MDPNIFDWLVAPLVQNRDGIVQFFNSVFFTTVLGASAGAYWGAKAAQAIAEKSKRRELLTREIRDTNAAMTIAASICGALLNLKKQHVQVLKEEYDKSKLGFIEHKRRRDAGEVAPEQAFEFRADLQTLTFPPLPIEILQKAIFERISVIGRPLSLATVLGQSVADLNMSNALRNSLIDAFKRMGQPINAYLYFGLRQGDIVNEEYPSSVTAIFRQTDDAIFFSHLLVRDLIEHGTQTAGIFSREIGKGAPRVSVQDFTEAVEAGLMPDDRLYSDWFTKFTKHEIPPTFVAKSMSWLKLRFSRTRS